MSPVFRTLILSCAVVALGACSSESSESSNPTGVQVPQDDSNGNGVQENVGNPGNESAGGDNTGGDNTTGNNTGGNNTGGENNGENGTGNEPGDNGQGNNSGQSFDPNLPPPVIPELDPRAAPIPAPDATDPFGANLEIDPELPVAGGAPTQPKNLRADLVSNDWAEMSWAPANDDGEVVEYRIDRSDGHTYVVRGDLTSDNGGTQAEIDKQWSTTSFIDCNYTRFAVAIHDCTNNTPQPGQTFTYTVTAVDDEGNRSAPSDPLTITYHQEQNAPVPLYLDRYLDDTNFAQNHDLSNPAYFLDKFSLVFEDDFDGTSIDSTRWNTELVWGDTTVINDEQQYFVNALRDPDFGYNPFTLSDSILTIEAIATPPELEEKLPPKCFETNDFRPPCLFLSGALSTHDKFNMTYGYVEARIKASDISGALSSFYLYHRFKGNGNELNAPEIDILEYLGENPFGDEDAFQTYHFDDVTTGQTRSSPTMSYANPTGELYSDDFHTFSTLWEPQLVIWYIDGQEIKRLSGPQVGARAMNIVTYLVTGSGWAPTPDLTVPAPIKLEIDYIRAYQRDAYRTNGLYPE